MILIFITFIIVILLLYNFYISLFELFQFVIKKSFNINTIILAKPPITVQSVQISFQKSSISNNTIKLHVSGEIFW